MGGQVTDQPDAAADRVAELGERGRSRCGDGCARHPGRSVVAGVAGGPGLHVEGVGRPVVAVVELQVRVRDHAPRLDVRGVELEVRLPHLEDVAEVVRVVCVGLTDREVRQVVREAGEGVGLQRTLSGTDHVVRGLGVVDRTRVDLPGVVPVDLGDVVEGHTEHGARLGGTTGRGRTDRLRTDDGNDASEQQDECRPQPQQCLLGQGVLHSLVVRCNRQGIHLCVYTLTYFFIYVNIVLKITLS